MSRTFPFIALRWLLLGLVAWACLQPATARADITTAPGSELEVYLVTYGPGVIYWERFGHDAIEIRDRSSGEAVNFNYGVFDFSQKNFLLNFARGYPRYSIDAEYSAPEIRSYVATGRFVHRQQLALTPSQRAALRDFLLWNLQPQNRQYIYNYYTSNCATRVRDALNRALGGTLKTQMQGPTAVTYRAETDRLMAGQPWLMLAMDLGLSGYADQPLSQWQAAFIPMQLMREIRTVEVSDGHGGTQPLVTHDEQIAAARLPAPPKAPPDLIPPLLGAGIVLALLLGVSGFYRARSRSAHVVFGVLGTLWLLFAGLTGLVMIGIWTLTNNRAGWANENLWLLNPVAFVLIPAVWRRVGSRFTRILVSLLAAAAVFALIAKLLPGFDQRNLPWIAFALPPWLALTALLWRRHPRATIVPAGPG